MSVEKLSQLKTTQESLEAKKVELESQESTEELEREVKKISQEIMSTTEEIKALEASMQLNPDAGVLAVEQQLEQEGQELEQKVSSLEQQELSVPGDMEGNFKVKKLKSEVLKIDALTARAEIFKVMRQNKVPESQYEVFVKEISQIPKEQGEKVLAGETLEEKELYETVTGAVQEINSIFEEIKNLGHTVESLKALRYSENAGDKALLEKFEEKISAPFTRFEQGEEVNPNTAFDILVNQASPEFLSLVADELGKHEKIPAQKVIDNLLSRYSSNTPEFEKISSTIERKILEQKRGLLQDLPLEETLQLAIDDEDVLGNGYDERVLVFQKRVSNEFNEILEEGNFSKNADFMQKTDAAGLRLYDVLPKTLRDEHFADKDVRAILVGEMPYWIYDRYEKTFKSNDKLKAYMPEDGPGLSVYRRLDNRSGTLDFERFQNILTQEGVVFKDCDVDIKLRAYTALSSDAVATVFSVEDFKELFNYSKSWNPEKIPEGMMPELRVMAKEHFFQTEMRHMHHAEGVNELVDKFQIKFSDFSPDERFILIKNEELRSQFKEEYSADDYRRLLQLKTEWVRMDQIPGNLIDALTPDLTQYAKENAKAVMQANDDLKYYLVLEDFQKLIGTPESVGTYVPYEYIPSEYQNEMEPSLIARGAATLKTQNYSETIDVLLDRKIRDLAFDRLVQEVETEQDPEKRLHREEKVSHLKKIKESFWAMDESKQLPETVREKIVSFREKYGEKGGRLIALAVAAYGLEDGSALITKLEQFEKVLDFHNPENIPEGAGVSFGIEYEVMYSTVHGYDKESGLDYRTDMSLIGVAANIKRGAGGFYEIATTPTENPYLLIAEVKMLQDAGMLDFNFQKYPEGSRGYHLSLGGESGLAASSPDMKFLYNTLTMTGNTGLLLGREVEHVKAIHSKNLDAVGTMKYPGERVEFKGMSTDSFEQFERTVLSTYHAGIATQLQKKYIGAPVEGQTLTALPDTVDQMNAYIDTHFSGALFATEQDKQILFEWLKFKKEMVLAVEQHNNAFIEGEFFGSVTDSEGNTKELGLRENYEYKRASYLGSASLDAAAEQQKYVIKQDLFETQDKDFVNALTRANNLITFKEAVLPDEKFVPDKNGKLTQRIKDEWLGNAPSVLTSMQTEGYQPIAGTPYSSLFDRGGEMRDGYYALQGTSEEMITHKSQILLNRFNKNVEALLRNPGVMKPTPELIYENQN